MSSTRQAVVRGPSLTGCGNRPLLTPAHQVERPTGIGPFGAMIDVSLTKPSGGRIPLIWLGISVVSSLCIATLTRSRTAQAATFHLKSPLPLLGLIRSDQSAGINPRKSRVAARHCGSSFAPEPTTSCKTSSDRLCNKPRFDACKAGLRVTCAQRRVFPAILPLTGSHLTSRGKNQTVHRVMHMNKIGELKLGT
jgi:hypothetical protein